MTSGVVAIGDATLYRGDMRDVLCLLDPVDAIVTDPPYHLTSGNQSFDWSALGENGHEGGPRGRTRKEGRKSGFMGQVWDGGDIAFQPETWATIGAALRPGGFLLAFGGTRTSHRMTCAIEDAGFVIQDTIAWLYGSGFPKNRAMLKPAFEPIVLAYKPGGKRTMQIGECRIFTNEQWGARGLPSGGQTVSAYGDGLNNSGRSGSSVLGRWPANICHDGSDEVVTAFPQSTSNATPRNRIIRQDRTQWRVGGAYETTEYGDSGSAARFFYCAKANKTDRAGSRHPTVKPQALMRWLVQLVTPPGGVVLDPFGGSGSTAQAALATGRRCVLIEREENWFQDACLRVEFAQPTPDFRMAAE